MQAVGQALARHATLALTMGTYTDVTLLDLRGAAGKAMTARDSAVDSVPVGAHFGALPRGVEGAAGGSDPPRENHA